MKEAKVAPYLGAWIEIARASKLADISRVAPYLGAWIEIDMNVWRKWLQNVAPYLGAWIEMAHKPCKPCIAASLPTWERGLKYIKAVWE